MSETSQSTSETHFCARCGEKLNSRPVWLELNTNTGLYHGEGAFPDGGLSQGCFAFGKGCAATVLAHGGVNKKIGRGVR